MTCPHTVESGAYVLGALSPAGREEYTQHLAECPACRAEVAELAGLPGLLGRLDAASADQLDDAPAAPPPSLLPDTLNRLRRSRSHSHRRRDLALVAALLLVVLGGAAAIGLRTGAAPPAHPPAAVVLSPMEQVGGQKSVEAQVALSDENGGTQIQMHCTYVDWGGGGGTEKPWRVSLYVYPKGGGDPGPATAVWTVSPGTEVEINAHTPLPQDRIDRLVLRLDDNTDLLTYPVA